MQKFNYHTHTYRCGHADYSMKDEDYVKEFIKKGFKKICFTDHCPQKNKIDTRSNMRMDYKEKEEYYVSIKDLKEKYKDIIDIEVGFEIEYAPNIEDDLFELKRETDKLVLGQHFVYDEDDKYLKTVGWGVTNDNDLRKYARYIEMALEKGLVDVVVHPDLFMLGKSKFGEIEKEISHIICKAAEKYNIPLEINLTRAALYLNNIINSVEYPNRDFWKIASEYNIKVIYGIDAHAKYQIDLYEDSVNFVNDKIIGKDIINKLRFCEEDLKWE